MKPGFKTTSLTLPAKTWEMLHKLALQRKIQKATPNSFNGVVCEIIDSAVEGIELELRERIGRRR